MGTEKLITKDMEDAEVSLFQKSCVGVVDPTLMILKVHLLTENYLERMVHICLKRGDRVINNGGLSYNQKLVLVDSFDVLDDSIIQCLKGLNKVRNQCAHEISKEITMSDVDIIGRPLGEQCTKYRIQSKNNPLIFLHSMLSFVIGVLAGFVAIHEKRILSESEGKEVVKKNNPKTHELN